MDSIERRKDREDFEGEGSSGPETPAAFGLTVARTKGVEVHRFHDRFSPPSSLS